MPFWNSILDLCVHFKVSGSDPTQALSVRYNDTDECSQWSGALHLEDSIFREYSSIF